MKKSWKYIKVGDVVWRDSYLYSRREILDISNSGRIFAILGPETDMLVTWYTVEGAKQADWTLQDSWNID